MTTIATATSSSIAARAASAFPVQACIGGFPLFKEDRIVLTRVSPRACEARVKSKRTRHVRVDASGVSELKVGCSCAPRSMGVATCKHLWATFLAIDRAGALEAMRAGVGPIALAPLDVDLGGDAGAEAPAEAPAAEPRGPKTPKAAASPAAKCATKKSADSAEKARRPVRGTPRSTGRHAKKT